MPGLIEAVGGSDWTYGASILTFVFPELLFIAVAGTLYVLYTKPHLVPGHRYNMELGSTAGTATPAMPGTEPGPPVHPAVDTGAIAREQSPGSDVEG